MMSERPRHLQHNHPHHRTDDIPSVMRTMALMSASIGVGSLLNSSSSKKANLNSVANGRALSPPPAGFTNGILRSSNQRRSGSTTPTASLAAQSFYSSPSATSSTTSILLPPADLDSRGAERERSGRDSFPSSSGHLAGSTDTSPTHRGRSLTPQRPALSSNFTSTTINPTTTPKIRFAPLPQARPRSYSTGRNVWLEPDTRDLTDPSEAGRERGWIRKNQAENGPVGMTSSSSSGELYGSAIDDGHLRDNDGDDVEDDDSEGQEMKTGGGKRSSLTSGLFSSSHQLSSSSKGSSGGGASSSILTSSESYTTKLLRPLSFGLVKPKKQPIARAPSSESISGRTGSRSSGNESEGDGRRRSGSSLGRHSDYTSGDDYSDSNTGATGVSLSKHRTRESNDGSDHSAAPNPRRQFPSAVQRSRKRPVVVAKPVVEPKFVEWGMRSVSGSGGGGLGNNSRGGRTTNPDQDEEEEGSGLAWIKRRKEERRLRAEVAAKKLAEDSAQEVLTDEDDQTPSNDSTPTFVLSDTLAGSGSATPTPSRLSASPARPWITTTTSSIPDQSPDSGFSSLPSPDLTSCPLPSTSSDEDDAQTPLTSTMTTPTLPSRPLILKRTSTLTRVGSDSYAVAASRPPSVGDDASSEDEIDHGEEEDDLDPEELAQEEALVEAAKMSAIGAGAESELFHESGFHDRVTAA